MVDTLSVITKATSNGGLVLYHLAMFDQRTHFSCVFDLLSKNATDEKAWKSVCDEVKLCLLGKLPRAKHVTDALEQDWFIRGSADAQKLGSNSIEIVSEAGVFSAEYPEFWSLRYEHNDNSEDAKRARRWRTDIGLTRTSGVVRVSVRISHFIVKAWYGLEPPAPSHSVPGLVNELIKGGNCFEARSGRNKLFARPFDIDERHVRALVNVLTDNERKLPVILISTLSSTGLTLLDADQLARNVAGIALVFTLSQQDAQRTFTDSVPEKFRAYNGAVRIYQPKVDLLRFEDSFRHRYFTADDVSQLGIDQVSALIVRGTLRSASLNSEEFVTTLEDLRFEVFRRTLGTGAEDHPEIVEPLLAEIENQKAKNQLLFEEYKQAYDQYEVTDRRLKDAEDDLRAQEKAMGTLRFQLRARNAAKSGGEQSDLDMQTKVLAATNGHKVVCIRSKQDGDFLKAIERRFGISTDEVDACFEEVMVEHGSNQVQGLMKAYSGRVVVYAWGHLKSMDAEETKGFSEYFEGQSPAKALGWFAQWFDNVTA